MSIPILAVLSGICRGSDVVVAGKDREVEVGRNKFVTAWEAAKTRRILPRRAFASRDGASLKGVHTSLRKCEILELLSPAVSLHLDLCQCSLKCNIYLPLYFNQILKNVGSFASL
jgi:hypothetical protein